MFSVRSFSTPYKRGALDERKMHRTIALVLISAFLNNTLNLKQNINYVYIGNVFSPLFPKNNQSYP